MKQVAKKSLEAKNFKALFIWKTKDKETIIFNKKWQRLLYLLRN